MTAAARPFAVSAETPLRRYWPLALFAAYFGIGLLLALPSLSLPWFNDDLFVLRPYTADELAQAFTGNWDFSGIATPGYRPLLIVYYHLTSLAFGESVVLHRLFSIALFALHLVGLAALGARLGMARGAAALAGVLILVTRNTWWVLTWPTDGVRSLVGIFGALAIYGFLLHLDKPAVWKAAASGLAFACALLIRDEALVYLALVPLIGAYRVLQGDWRHRLRTSAPALRRIALHALVLAVIAAAFLLIRREVVAETPFRIAPLGLIWSLGWVFVPRLPFLPDAVWLGAMAVFWLLMGALMRGLPQRGLALLWLACAVIAAAPGLVVTRGNTLLLPICFFCLFLATVLHHFFTNGGVINGSRCCC
jgi:hypothetical protein